MNQSIPRCNHVSESELSDALNRALLLIKSFHADDKDCTNPVILTALAWHIAEYRPTPVTHGYILDVPAQDVYNAITKATRPITVRRLARAWSRSISAVLSNFAHLENPVFTTQCNDTFVNVYDKIAVAPFFFDGVDTATIPPSVSRVIATGLAYSKRSQTNSPFSFHKRPTFVSQQTENLNNALDFTGRL
jgi:hypothetical protein